MKKYTLTEAEQLLANATKIGMALIKAGKAPKYSDSIVSETFLVDLLRLSAKENGINPDHIVHHGGHSFPDVTIANSAIGIELKGSVANRKFNGNSVVASTMLPDLEKIFIFYWIGTPGEVGYNDYFSCVSTPVVTHSPRFQLDIDLAPNDSMFGTGPRKVGTTEEIIFGENGIDSQKIIKWMADNARSRGEEPWWISEDESLPTGSTGLIRCTNLPVDKRKAFMKSAFLAFPKILDRSSPNKYNRLFEWAIFAKSILSTRDDFSAGGKAKIKLLEYSNLHIDVPQVIQVAIDSLSSNHIVSLREIEEPYQRKFKDKTEFLIYYEKILPQYLTHIYSDVRIHDKKGVKAEGFTKLLATHIVEKIDRNTLINN